MATITIDTAEFVERLTRAKVSRPQAEAIVKSIERDVKIDIEEDMGELVTKADLNAAILALKGELKEDILMMKLSSQKQHLMSVAILAGLITALKFWS